MSYGFSSLSESGFIPTFSCTQHGCGYKGWFSSLSESGFIPTGFRVDTGYSPVIIVLISFREWLHSYEVRSRRFYGFRLKVLISFREWLHSYVQRRGRPTQCGGIVLISFREWLHSYKLLMHSKKPLETRGFSSLSESGFIPTTTLLSQGVLWGFVVLISFREWLHSYFLRNKSMIN